MILVSGGRLSPRCIVHIEEVSVIQEGQTSRVKHATHPSHRKGYNYFDHFSRPVGLKQSYFRVPRLFVSALPEVAHIKVRRVCVSKCMRRPVCGEAWSSSWKDVIR